MEFQSKYNQQLKKLLMDDKTEKILELSSEIEILKAQHSQIQEQRDELSLKNQEHQTLIQEQMALIKQLNVRGLTILMITSLSICISTIIWILWDLVGSINSA
jgi:hypothetical protein